MYFVPEDKNMTLWRVGHLCRPDTLKDSPICIGAPTFKRLKGYTRYNLGWTHASFLTRYQRFIHIIISSSSIHSLTCRRKSYMFHESLQIVDSFPLPVRSAISPHLLECIFNVLNCWQCIKMRISLASDQRCTSLLHMSLDWPLVIRSYFSALYADQHVGNT